MRKDMTKIAVTRLEPKQASDSWNARIRSEVVENILPFWPRHVLDREAGGFFGTVHSNLVADKEAPRSSVVNTRILWAYAAGARLIDPSWRPIAEWAFDAVAQKFVDQKMGGLFWSVDRQGRPVSDRKQTYAQAFGIYGLAEHHRLTNNPASLELAIALYRLIEQHCHDPVSNGYIEARGRDWQPLADMRLSDKDLNCPKSMNTHLHVLEAYTNLGRLWRDAGLKARLREVLLVMLDRIVDSESGHFKLFFDERWNALPDHVSFGHDIEGSWLLVEAAEVLGDPALLARARDTAMYMATAALEQGLDGDGSMLFAADADGRLIDTDKHWWVQAEAVVGFFNAWQISGDRRFREASRKAWDYIETHVVDRQHGEWHAKLNRAGTPLTETEDPEAVLAGFWKCPYHNARVCYEMLGRLAETKPRM
jgi:mannobiose 2-epimerase